MKKGIKQSFVSDKLGFKSHSSYAHIEIGKQKLPVDKVPLLAEILGVSIEELFFEEEIRITRNDVTA